MPGRSIKYSIKINPATMMKVLYNALHLTGQYSGVQHTEELLMKEAFRDLDMNIRFEALCPKKYHPDFPESPFRTFRSIEIDNSRRWQRIWYEQFWLSKKDDGQKVELLHCPSYILPWNWKEKCVVTIHDTISLDFPEYCPFANRSYFRFALPYSIHRADRIIAVSHTVKKDILRRFPKYSSKIEVVYHGIDDIFNTAPTVDKLTGVRKKYGLPEKYILFVGNIEPKKNVARLIEAFRNLVKHSNTPHSLVIAGQFAWKYGNVMNVKKQKDQRIIFPGYICQSDLPSVYTLADLFVFPSLYEGFGIPPLEAMACGTPAIVSNAGALPETTGGNALMVDPFSVSSIENAMYQLLHENNLRANLVEKGREHVQQFKWKTAWEKTFRLYQSLIYENHD
jgi:glycosyltransferase involved in cell wall biosynthesis